MSHELIANKLKNIKPSEKLRSAFLKIWITFDDKTSVLSKVK